ncbi:hypothetical protein COP2_015447 [Malus domestica]
MSWILNSMEPKLSEIFSYSDSSHILWESIKEMYGSQHNAARVFELKKSLAGLKQGDQTFIQHLGSMKSMWNELDLYCPHTTESAVLLKRADEDKVFQLLASLGVEYEDLRSHLLMTPELPSFVNVCHAVQREETRRKVMHVEPRSSPEARVFTSNHNFTNERSSNRRKADWKCTYCNTKGHVREKCWILHPELKPKFNKEGKMIRDGKGFAPKAFQSLSYPSNEMSNFTSNPISLINEFAAFLQKKSDIADGNNVTTKNPTEMLGKFVGFLANSNTTTSGNIPGIICALSTALNVYLTHDFWIIDSGATDHITNKQACLHEFQKLPNPTHVSVANGKGEPVLGKGKIKLMGSDVESTALYVPSFPFQLLSIGKITHTLNCLAIFSPHTVVFQDRVTQKKIGEGFFLNGLYYLSKEFNRVKEPIANLSHVQKHQLWHQRLAHPFDPVMSKLFPNYCTNTHECEICQMSKATRLPFVPSKSRTSKPFEVVHSDIWGPSRVESFDGYKYFVTFIDDYSRVTWLYLLKSKSEVFTAFQDFHKLITNHFSSKIFTLRSDNGTEYTSYNLSNYLSSHGILHQTSCVGTPQQNGVAERKNRDLLEKTRSLMFQMQVPKRLWSQALLTAAYIINRLPTRVLNSKSHFEVMKGRTADLTHFRIFGCTCYVHVQANHRDKLEPRAIKCVFMGYSSSQKGYKCYNPHTGKLVVSRDVRFDEHVPFFNNHSPNSSQGESLMDIFPLPTLAEIHTDTPPYHPISDHPVDEMVSEDIPRAPAPVVATQPIVAAPKRNPTRDRNPHRRLQEYITYSARHPISEALTYHKLSASHASFLSQLANNVEPKNFQEAVCMPVWRDAMHDELKALNENKTWSVVDLPKGKKAVGSRWIYKTKFNSNGTIERHKARLVARGFTQTYGIDYKETFAPVAKMNTVRVLLSVAVNHDWPLFQMDVKNAFLHGELQEEVYMKLPQGHPQEKEPTKVCKLHKAIYGLKQSPQAWYAKLSSVLEVAGFTRSHADSSLFVRSGDQGKLVVLIYVDDLIITGDNMDELEALKRSLHQQFAIKDLGSGIEMATSSKGLFLNQRKYVLDLLDEAHMVNCKPARTPLASKLQLDAPGNLLSNPNVYQRMVGKLIYLTITRPDIAYSVSLISQFMHSPTLVHWEIVKRILRYLKGSIGRGILMQKNESNHILAYTDADWAGNSLDRKSTTGFCTFVGGNLVTWKSKKQTVVARSSAEAEYRAMAATASELIWLKSLLLDLGFTSKEPMSLFCDNQAAMHIASNPVFHERTKHIEVDCHYIRTQVQSKVIETVYTRSHDQLADLFTKALDFTQFQRLLFKLGSINPLDPA